MNKSKCWLALLVAGLVVNALDVLVQGKLLTDAYYSHLAWSRQDTPVYWFIVGDFVAVAVFIWVYGKVASAFSDGAKGGACAGFVLGVLVNFPAWEFMHLMVRDFPYALTWIETVYGILWYVVMGAIVGAITKKPVAASA